MTVATRRKMKLYVRASLMAAGGVCMSLVATLPAQAVTLTIAGTVLLAIAGLVGVGEMNAAPPRE